MSMVEGLYDLRGRGALGDDIARHQSELRLEISGGYRGSLSCCGM